MTFYCCHAYLISCFLFVCFVFWEKWASIEQKRAHCQTVCSHKSCGPLSFLYLGHEMSCSEFLWRGVLCCSVYLFSACCCLCCSSPPHVHTMMGSCLIWYCWGLSILSSHGMCPLTSGAPRFKVKLCGKATTGTFCDITPCIMWVVWVVMGVYCLRTMSLCASRLFNS